MVKFFCRVSKGDDWRSSGDRVSSRSASMGFRLIYWSWMVPCVVGLWPDEDELSPVDIFVCYVCCCLKWSIVIRPTKPKKNHKKKRRGVVSCLGFSPFWFSQGRDPARHPPYVVTGSWCIPTKWPPGPRGQWRCEAKRTASWPLMMDDVYVCVRESVCG